MMEKVYDYDHATGKSELRNPTAEEVSEMKKLADAKLIESQKEDARAIAKTALLERIGITADEAALLLS